MQSDSHKAGPPMLSFMIGTILVIAVSDSASYSQSQSAPASQVTGFDAGQTRPDETVQSTADIDPFAIFSAPMLREGSRIVDATARIVRDPRTDSWMAVIDAPNRGTEGEAKSGIHMLTILPCSKLSEMQRIIDAGSSASSSQQPLFKLSGQVFVYRDRNYILPMHAPVLAEAPIASLSNADHTPGTLPSTQTSTQPGAGAALDNETAADELGRPAHADDQSAEKLLRDLERAAGPGVKTGSLERRNKVNEPDTSGVKTAANKLMREGTAIVNRRGRITRDGSGGWLFVFDADASGVAGTDAESPRTGAGGDPPMRLLPCMLLERIEDYARRSGRSVPTGAAAPATKSGNKGGARATIGAAAGGSGGAAILNGVIYTYNGQNFLLPTVFRIPQERANLSP